jgi:hypothetical protein
LPFGIAGARHGIPLLGSCGQPIRDAPPVCPVVDEIPRAPARNLISRQRDTFGMADRHRLLHEPHKEVAGRRSVGADGIETSASGD